MVETLYHTTSGSLERLLNAGRKSLSTFIPGRDVSHIVQQSERVSSQNILQQIDYPDHKA